MFFIRNKCSRSPAHLEWKWTSYYLCKWPWRCSEESSGKCGQKIIPWRYLLGSVHVLQDVIPVVPSERIGGIFLGCHQCMGDFLCDAWQTIDLQIGLTNFCSCILEKYCLHLALIILVLRVLLTLNFINLFSPFLPELPLINTEKPISQYYQSCFYIVKSQQTDNGFIFLWIFTRM